MGLAIRHSLLASHPVGITLQVAAFLLMIWGRISLGWRSFHPGANTTSGGLVTKGAFRFFRHPIYAAIFYFLWIAAITHPDLINFGLVLFGTGCIAVRIYAEEQFLFAQYPEYDAYAARTKRIIPFVV